jgi:hypothetical protein
MKKVEAGFRFALYFKEEDGCYGQKPALRGRLRRAGFVYI